MTFNVSTTKNIIPTQGPSWLPAGEDREYYPRLGQQYPRCTIMHEDWNIPDPDYKPLDYTSEKVTNPKGDGKKAVWADDLVISEETKSNFNKVDVGLKITRVSFHGKYKLDKDNKPLNPLGRTGITGLGHLGRYGPNHAADPIATRYKRDEQNKILMNKLNVPRIEFAAVLRSNGGGWAIPGGMVESGADVPETLINEYIQEALIGEDQSEENQQRMKILVQESFKNGEEIFRGIVFDSRNTDNAWMETVAVNFHDETGEGLAKRKLIPDNKETKNAVWLEITDDIKLFASHAKFVLDARDKIIKKWLQKNKQ